jgi:hypothetical protein
MNTNKRHTRFIPFLLLLPVLLSGCSSKSGNFSAAQQQQMKGNAPPTITPDQRAQMEAALRAHMGHPPAHGSVP